MVSSWGKKKKKMLDKEQKVLYLRQCLFTLWRTVAASVGMDEMRECDLVL